MELDKILKEDFINSDPELTKLIVQLNRLHKKLRAYTFHNFKRINPFYEDLFDWKERGAFLFGEEKNITVYNTCTIVGDVDIGENTWVGPYTALDGKGGLKIGKFCSISAGVNIVTHDTVKWALSGGKAAYEYDSISIGDYCFIGTGAMITKGVTIGNHCLIGAGAVVTKDIPDFSIALGIPAQIVGRTKINEEMVELIFNDSAFDSNDK